MITLQMKLIAADQLIQFEETKHPSPFQCSIEVLPEQSSNEVDHINNIEYLRWIDKASQLHCDVFGWTRDRLLEENIMWFVARHEIDYRSEAKSTDTLLLTTWVEDVRKVKSWRTTYIHVLGEHPRVVCQCKTLWVLVDLHTRKPTTVPIEMAKALEPLTPPRGIGGLTV